MSSASRAIDRIVELLAVEEITAHRDVEDLFSGGPIGVLVGLPAKVGATLSGSTFEVPVYVISADPVNTSATVDRLYAEADAAAHALYTLGYRVSSWGGRAGTEPLTAAEITVTVTVSQEV